MTLVALVQSDCNTTQRTYQNKIREHNLVVLPDWTSLKQLVVVSSWVLEDHIKSHLSNMDSCPYPYEWANVKLVHPPSLGRSQYMIALGALNLDLLLTKANHGTEGIEGSGHCISKNIIIWLTFATNHISVFCLHQKVTSSQKLPPPGRATHNTINIVHIDKLHN